MFLHNLISMKAALFLVAFATGLQPAGAGDILFTNRTATFTNFQGKTYAGVQLVRGDLDGLIWRDGVSGGRVCYTNLHPDILESFGIPTNRIEMARSRAEKRALAYARYRAQVFAQAQARSRAQVGSTDGDTSLSRSNAPAIASDGYNPLSPYGPDSMYPPYWYGPFLPFGPAAPSAPGAAAAPAAAGAPFAGPAPNGGLSPSAAPAANPAAAQNAAPAASAPSAPPAFVTPTPPRRRH